MVSGFEAAATGGVPGVDVDDAKLTVGDFGVGGHHPEKVDAASGRGHVGVTWACLYRGRPLRAAVRARWGGRTRRVRIRRLDRELLVRPL